MNGKGRIDSWVPSHGVGVKREVGDPWRMGGLYSVPPKIEPWVLGITSLFLGRDIDCIRLTAALREADVGSNSRCNAGDCRC